MDAEALQHFLTCATRGKHPTSSGGEKIAYKIAKALHALGDDVCCVDGEVIEGVCTMLKLMHGPWQTHADKQSIYSTLARAAGKKS